MGLDNTGWHVSHKDYLDTKKFSDSVNKEYPSRTEVFSPIEKTFSMVPENSFCFGHVWPLRLAPYKELKGDMRIIASSRSPKDALVSEFIDFRYRRKDLGFVSPDVIKDDVEAFTEYLKVQGEIIRKIYLRFLVTRMILGSPLRRVFFPNWNMITISYDELFKTPNLEKINEISDFIRSKKNYKMNDYMILLQKDNKTKNEGISVDRSLLWTAENLKIYKKYNFNLIERFL
jgi:hypothetical protein